MISTLNNLLKPLENAIIKYQKVLGYGILAFSPLALYFAQSYKLSLEAAEFSILLLVLILWIPIFSRVFGIKIFTALSGLRKELGIVMGIFAMVHLYGMWGNLEYYLEKQPILFALGIIPQIIIFLLTITSSDFARKKMGKNWKRLHRLVYVVPVFVLFQIAMGTGQLSFVNGISFGPEFNVGPWIIWSLYYIFKVLEWRGVQLYTPEVVTYPKGQKFLCVPCGYIYDPTVGDEKDGIPAGTEFADIPDSWRCPDCGVTKADFVPYNEGDAMPTETVKVKEKIYLNPTTIELVIELENENTAKIGQFATFEYTDENGTFRRQYSVAKQDGKQVHFLIKIQKDGRGGKILESLSVGDTMNFIGFFGDFILRENNNPKVFIATGTGLAPIYRMMMAAPKAEKQLYISVATKSDVFYREELEAIPNLQVNYFVSRECVEGFCEGRMDVDAMRIGQNAEVYLCGNPKMIADFVPKLKERGLAGMYYEEFL